MTIFTSDALLYSSETLWEKKKRGGFIIDQKQVKEPLLMFLVICSFLQTLSVK